ncbi:cytochrome P450 [Ceratobasidium sp. AG-I]|nr:cytochrome P450 [Ceratobasidium sp. AG-I]
MTSLPLVALDDVLKYATRENLLYLFGGLLFLKIGEWTYWPIRKLFSPLRHLRGPKNESLVFGNLKRIFGAQNSVLHEEWVGEYGLTFAYRGFLSSYRLYTVDTRALNFIMTQTNSFAKPEAVRRNLADVLGEGLLFAEGDTHKRQRRIMNPSFGPPQVRELVPIFWEKSIKLKDIWINEIKANPEGKAVIDVLPWLSRATLDIIGVAGFDYHFNSLEGGDEDELSRAFMKVFEAGQDFNLLAILKNFIPVLRLIPTARTRSMAASMATMHRVGMKLIDEKKTALAQDSKTGSTTQGRDLLTLLIKSNLAYENEAHRMSDEEVLGQISTFLTAGHETTSTSTTWALYVLTKHPEVQRKLRQELLECGLGDEPSMNDLDKLPYLDNVVRECLRVHPAVPSTVREAAQDINVPVAKPFKNRHGVEQDSIIIQKRDTVFIPILAMNRVKHIWGEDAMEFRPERWDNLPEAAKDMPGVWSHLMTFIHGNRACIGYRFALIEMKALMYTLVRAVEFDIDPTIEIEGRSIVTRPRVVSQPEKGNQMPLICKVVQGL